MKSKVEIKIVWESKIKLFIEDHKKNIKVYWEFKKCKCYPYNVLHIDKCQ